MELGEYENIYRHENKHFFYVSTHDYVIKLIEKYKSGENLDILDAGCGTGLLAVKMNKFGNVKTFDASLEAIKWAKKRGINPKIGSLEKIPFKSNCFDVVTCIDVLVHAGVKDDRKAIKELFRVLKPSGILVIRVAANKWLDLQHDKVVHGARRYDLIPLANKIKSEGFKIHKITYVHASLFPFIVGKHLIEKLNRPHKHASSVSDIPVLINGLLTKWLLTENKILQFINAPFGVGIVAVGGKPISDKQLQ